MLKTPRELMKGWEEILGKVSGRFFSKKNSVMPMDGFRACFFLFGMVTSREKNVYTNHEQPSFQGLETMTCWIQGFQGDATKGIQVTNMGILAEKRWVRLFFYTFFFEEKHEADFHIYFLGEFVSDM